MAKHYIITNRPVRVKNGREQIDESNQAATTYNLRFGTAEIVKGRDGKPKAKVELIPDVPVHNNQFAELNYENVETEKTCPAQPNGSSHCTMTCPPVRKTTTRSSSFTDLIVAINV